MTRTLTTLLALAVLLLIMAWLRDGPTVKRDPELFNQYRMTHLEGH